MTCIMFIPRKKKIFIRFYFLEIKKLSQQCLVSTYSLDKPEYERVLKSSWLNQEEIVLKKVEKLYAKCVELEMNIVHFMAIGNFFLGSVIF